MKRILLMILVASMLMSTLGFAGIAADRPVGTPISTVEEFLAMEAQGVYYLTCDLDFSGKTYKNKVYSKAFSGVLDGNGYALLGITVSSTNADAGIFANGFSGTLKNITIGSEEDPVSITTTGSGYSVAAVAGTMAGGANFDTVTIYANVRGDGKTSGITSFIPSGKVTVKNSAVYGTMIGNPAAGFFALSNDYAADIEISNSFNYATVTAKNKSAGGFYTVDAATGGKRQGTVTVTGCVNFGDITASDWRVGGIVGEFNEESTSELYVDYCYNMGSITMTGGGGFAAGIVGGACFHAPSGRRSITNVYNGGEIKNTASSSNAFQIAYAQNSSNTLTIENATYLSGTAQKNMKTTNVVGSSTLEKLSATVTAYPETAAGLSFLAGVESVNDGYPVLSHESTLHENVTNYACGRRYCNDCNRILSKESEENHTYDETVTAPNGYLEGYTTSVCKYCGEIKVEITASSPYTPALVDGAYEIDSLDDLKWYQANLAQGLMSGYESLKLAVDLDLNGEAFEPIGNTAHPFSGKFDGGLHTVSNFVIASEGVGGFFGVLGMGADISYLKLTGATVTAKGAAGALFGSVASRANVTIRFIILDGVTVTSEEANAGALGGSTSVAMSAAISNVIAPDATVSGKYVGGLLGFGNYTVMTNCYVNAVLNAPSSSAKGAMAYTTGSFSAKNSFYVKNGAISKYNGSAIDADAFLTSETIYTVNTYVSKSVFGLVDGEVVFGNAPCRVFYGEKQVFTTTVLSDGGDVCVYTDGMTVAIAVKRARGPRLCDLTLKFTVKGEVKTVSFDELTLTRRVTLGDTVASVSSDTALYTLSLEGVTAYEFGSFGGSVIIK